MVNGKSKTLAVGKNGTYQQDMRLLLRNIGIVRLVAYGDEKSGMYFYSHPGAIDEANAICGMKYFSGLYSKINISPSDYRILRKLMPKTKGESIRLSAEAKSLIDKLTERSPYSLY